MEKDTKNLSYKAYVSLYRLLETEGDFFLLSNGSFFKEHSVEQVLYEVNRN